MTAQAQTREVGSANLQVAVVTLTAGQPSQQILPADPTRRGAVIYTDPDATQPAYLADSEQHANKGIGAKLKPDRGIETATTAGAFVFAKAPVPAAGVTVYAIIETGEDPPLC